MIKINQKGMLKMKMPINLGAVHIHGNPMKEKTSIKNALLIML